MKVIAATLLSAVLAQGIKKRTNLATSEVKKLEAACAAWEGEFSGPAALLCSPTGSDALRDFILNKASFESVQYAFNKNQCEGDNCSSGTLNLEALFGYGCWCFFGRIDSALGRGPPVDAYDATCQKLALCYRCIFVDAANEGDDECDPFTATFTASFSLGSLTGQGVNNATTTCQTDNQNSCSWRTCSCAMTMMTSFFNLSFDPNNAYDENLKHSQGFDYNLECPEQGRAVDRQCCGYYPERRTYDHGDGSVRACCHEKSIYNPMKHVCCADGTHVGIGHSC